MGKAIIVAVPVQLCVGLVPVLIMNAVCLLFALCVLSTVVVQVKLEAATR